MYPIRLVALISIAGLAQGAATPGGQRIDLTPMSVEQRWDRASMHVSLFAIMLIREGTKAGKGPEAVGRELATLFGPWSDVTTPEQMARTIFRNWQLWRTVDFVADRSSDGTVAVTTNRPYQESINRYKNIAVSASDFDKMFAAFHETIARQQGLDFRQTVDGTTVTITIRPRR